MCFLFFNILEPACDKLPKKFLSNCKNKTSLFEKICEANNSD